MEAVPPTSSSMPPSALPDVLLVHSYPIISTRGKSVLLIQGGQINVVAMADWKASYARALSWGEEQIRRMHCLMLAAHLTELISNNL